MLWLHLKDKLKKLGSRKVILVYLLLGILTLPAFIRMLRPGIFSMQDFHVFRLFEFDKCVKDLQIPCRWAPDAGFGYGEPLFNYYGQLVYAIGEIFVLAGFSYIDATKILFILSLLLSAFSMYLLAKFLWKSDIAGILSAVIYTYAPYRALDIYVRGALPEAFAFVFFPLITFLFLKFVEKRTRKNLIAFVFSLTGLVLTHNLSLVMYMLFFIPLATFKIYETRDLKLVRDLFVGFLLTGLLSAFYLLPVYFERGFVDLSKVTVGFFDYRAHFATVKQLLVERKWGYGASLWGPVDDLSLSVGYGQWLLPLITLPFIVLRKINYRYFLLFFAIGWLALLLTHNKSTPIWETLSFMKFFQFPWRFLAIATFAFSLAGGALPQLIKKLNIRFAVVAAIILIAFSLNISFFREDIWYDTTDAELFSGESWNIQRAASLVDYWPSHAKSLPDGPAPETPIFSEGQGKVNSFEKNTNQATVDVTVDSTEAKISLPIVYFPGWGPDLETEGEMGLIATSVKKGHHILKYTFRNTPVRTVGNLLTLITFGFALTWLFPKKRTTNEN